MIKILKTHDLTHATYEISENSIKFKIKLEYVDLLQAKELLTAANNMIKFYRAKYSLKINENHMYIVFKSIEDRTNVNLKDLTDILFSIESDLTNKNQGLSTYDNPFFNKEIFNKVEAKNE